jgi:hypothetical protein
MELDESIIQLGAKLDEWFEGNLATFASLDRVAQSKALVRGFALVKELDRLKADGLAAVTALLSDRHALADDGRAASLLRGFEFASRLADALHDELLDTDGEAKVWRLMDAIVQALDKIGSGRAALAVLLDHSDAGLRAAAGAYLIDLMPERVVPILREIDEKGGGVSADFGARWTLLAWEREGQSRFKSLRAPASKGSS